MLAQQRTEAVSCGAYVQANVATASAASAVVATVATAVATAAAVAASIVTVVACTFLRWLNALPHVLKFGIRFAANLIEGKEVHHIGARDRRSTNYKIKK